MHDSKYEFSQGSSILDMPWISFEELANCSKISCLEKGQVSQKEDDGEEAVLLDSNTATSSSSNTPVPCASVVNDSKLFFESVVYPGAMFDVGAAPLRDYFTSTTELCENPTTFAAMTQTKAG